MSYNNIVMYNSEPIKNLGIDSHVVWVHFEKPIISKGFPQKYIHSIVDDNLYEKVMEFLPKFKENPKKQIIGVRQDYCNDLMRIYTGSLRRTDELKFFR